MIKGVEDKKLLEVIDRMLEDVKTWNVRVDRVELLGGMSYCKIIRDYVTQKIQEDPQVFISFLQSTMKLLHKTLLM